MKIQILKNYLLDLNFLRKALRYNFFAKKYSKDLRLKILKNPSSGRVLVLSPHPDDEIFGCGGALAKHSQQKDRVKIIYLTGRGERKKEAKVATQILGIDDLIFLGFEDGNLSAGREEIAAVKKIINNFKPDLIYAPFWLDPHPDHRATTEILNNILTRINFKGEIWSYEIWQPLMTNRIIKIDAVFAQKVLAIKAYKSQLQERGYLRAIKGLNSYRAGMFKAGEHAEAFYICKKDLYQKLLEFRI